LKKIRAFTNTLKELRRELEEISEGGYEEASIDIENANVLLDETIALWGEDVKKRVEEYMECDETRH
jgi:hypothetical protein